MALFKIGVSGLALASATDAPQGASASDLSRARTKVPGDHVRGSGHSQMVQSMNKQLMKASGSTATPCEEWTAEELVILQRHLFAKADPQLQAIYRATADNRQLPTEDITELEALWADEMATLKQHPALHDVTRDGKCHEAVMWFTHHLADRNRDGMTVPFLPVRDKPHTKSDFGGAAPSAVVDTVLDGYAAALSCAVCHASPVTETNTESTVWPQEVLYTATGHGAFPFWDLGTPGCDTCDPSVSNSAQVKVMLSSKLGMENLMHESCGDMTWTGATGAPNNSPCNHIFHPDEGAFIYTPKTVLSPEADGEFCCRTYVAGDKNFPGAVPRDWMRSSTYKGELTGFSGDHHSGTIKSYQYSFGGLQFWYSETADGKPVEQGEGCYQPGAAAKEACDHLLPIMVWHEFNTFEEATYIASDFTVPDVCLTTTTSCTGPGGGGAAAVV